MDNLAITRFWSKVERRGPDECWPWKGGLNKKGYGRARIAGQRTRRAHRVAYLLTYGELPESKLVMHTCDNPRCCNPAHLKLGDAWENVADMDAKGRRAKRAGSRMPSMEIQLPRPLLDRLRAYSKIEGRSMVSIIRVALEREFALRD